MAAAAVPAAAPAAQEQQQQQQAAAKPKVDRSVLARSIKKGATDVVFGRLPGFDDIIIYAKVFKRLQNQGKAKNDAAWMEQLAAEYGVSQHA